MNQKIVKNCFNAFYMNDDERCLTTVLKKLKLRSDKKLKINSEKNCHKQNYVLLLLSYFLPFATSITDVQIK